MFCSKCGKNLSDSVNFCDVCGNKIERVAPAPVKPVEVQPVVDLSAAPQLNKRDKITPILALVAVGLFTCGEGLSLITQMTSRFLLDIFNNIFGYINYQLYYQLTNATHLLCKLAIIAGYIIGIIVFIRFKKQIGAAISYVSSILLGLLTLMTVISFFRLAWWVIESLTRGYF